jgi:predicted RNA-binding protein (virulence factor B family)
MEYLKDHGGVADVSDKTPPEFIHTLFGISKKTFKSAIGNLYKQGLIVLEKDGIKLTDKHK